jgi:hypothetical protein
MPIDVETLSTGQLENLIVNHRRKRATNAPLYIAPIKPFRVSGSIFPVSTFGLFTTIALSKSRSFRWPYSASFQSRARTRLPDYR